MSAMRAPSEFTLWTIYDRPSDYPAHVVVRPFTTIAGRDLPLAGPCTLHHDLKDARRAIPKGLVCFPRVPEDDPNVVEVWL